MTVRSSEDSERSFGISVGTMLCVIAALLLWRARVGRAELLGALGLVLLVCGLGRPSLLTWPSAWWWRLSRALGHVNARVLLTLLFTIVLIPMSLVWRAAGTDPLARRRARWIGWLPSPASRHDRTHYARMY
jgi:hypothetical protein